MMDMSSMSKCGSAQAGQWLLWCSDSAGFRGWGRSDAGCMVKIDYARKAVAVGLLRCMSAGVQAECMFGYALHLLPWAG